MVACLALYHTLAFLFSSHGELLAPWRNLLKDLAIAGGVSANSELRREVKLLETEMGIRTFIPKFEYCTDNAAMIGIAAYYKFLNKEFADLDSAPSVRMGI